VLVATVGSQTWTPMLCKCDVVKTGDGCQLRMPMMDAYVDTRLDGKIGRQKSNSATRGSYSRRSRSVWQYSLIGPIKYALLSVQLLQVLKHFWLPQHLPTLHPPTALNTTVPKQQPCLRLVLFRLEVLPLLRTGMPLSFTDPLELPPTISSPILLTFLSQSPILQTRTPNSRTSQSNVMEQTPRL
jgi:hypothetical protein